MTHALASLNPLAILAVSLLGFFLGALWYSRLLFVRPWMADAKITPEMWKAKPGRGPILMGATFLLTIVSTTTLATLLAANYTRGALRGAELGVLLGVGLVAARHATNELFELKTIRHYAIVSGFDVALFAVQGAILGVWR